MISQLKVLVFIVDTPNKNKNIAVQAAILSDKAFRIDISSGDIVGACIHIYLIEQCNHLIFSLSDNVDVCVVCDGYA